MQNKQPSSEAFPVADSAPYPPLKVTGPNIQAACRLSQALAGAKSEMTAIMSYEYQHWILASCRPELAVTVFRIAKVEMHHLDMLGQLIVLLGADPRFGCDQRGSCAWWSGSMVCYSHDVRQILLNHITDEKKAAEFYRTAACDIPDPCVAAVLNRIARDEVLHAEIFTRFLKDCQ